jgi:hypothetical protein
MMSVKYQAVGTETNIVKPSEKKINESTSKDIRFPVNLPD